jgi:hypothetical protein
VTATSQNYIRGRMATLKAAHCNHHDWGTPTLSDDIAPHELRPGDRVSVYIPKTKHFKEWGHRDLVVIEARPDPDHHQVVTASGPGVGAFRFYWNKRSLRGHDTSPTSRLSYRFIDRP